jgi:hypothetical protein
MKIWCLRKTDTAIKWRALLVVGEPSPLAYVALTFSVKLRLRKEVAHNKKLS